MSGQNFMVRGFGKGGNAFPPWASAGLWAAAMLIVGLQSAVGLANTVTEYRSKAAFLAAFPPAEPRKYDNTLSDLGLLGPGELSSNSRAYSGNGFSYDTATAGYALYVAGTTQDPWLTSVDYRPPLVIANISGPAAGQFGIGGQFFLTNVDGDWAAGSLSVTATLAGGGTFTTTLSSPAATDFLGLSASRAITTLSLLSPSANLYPTIGGILVIVPEPLPASLLATAAVCFALMITNKGNSLLSTRRATRHRAVARDD